MFKLYLINFCEKLCASLVCILFREDVSQLSYITMCIKESLRLYPVVAEVGKLLAEDIVMSGQRFSKGIYVIIAACTKSLYSLQKYLTLFCSLGGIHPILVHAPTQKHFYKIALVFKPSYDTKNKATIIRSILNIEFKNSKSRRFLVSHPPSLPLSLTTFTRLELNDEAQNHNICLQQLTHQWNVPFEVLMSVCLLHLTTPIYHHSRHLLQVAKP